MRAGRTAPALDRGNRVARTRLVQVEHGHPGAGAGQPLRDGAPDAAGGAGDHRHLAGERHGSSALAMMSRMISLVPPPMVISRASRAKRSTAYSRM